MRYEIYHNTTLINTIICDPDYIEEYCELGEYSYKELSEPIKTEMGQTSDIPNNKTLSAKIQAIIDQQSFLEDCIAEMATEVYA